VLYDAGLRLFADVEVVLLLEVVAMVGVVWPFHCVLYYAGLRLYVEAVLPLVVVAKVEVVWPFLSALYGDDLSRFARVEGVLSFVLLL
jgi:hypothetical protein